MGDYVECLREIHYGKVKLVSVTHASSKIIYELQQQVSQDLMCRKQDGGR